MPSWYPTIRAARYAGVPAWELAGRAHAWTELYLAAERAELEAANDRRQAAERAQRRRGTLGPGR